MKDLTIKIVNILYTNKQIELVRKYTEKTFYQTLEAQLHDECTNWIDRALGQVNEQSKIKSKNS